LENVVQNSNVGIWSEFVTFTLVELVLELYPMESDCVEGTL